MKPKDTIIDYLKYWSEHTPKKTAFTFLHYTVEDDIEEEAVTCQQIYQTARKYSSLFKKKGIEKEEPVIVLAIQTPETIYAIYGLIMIGAIPVLVPYPSNVSKKQRLKTTIQDSGSKWLIGLDDTTQLPEEIITVLNPKENSNNLSMLSEEDITLSDLVCLLYTSGSINLPKGVMISQKNIMSSLKLIENSYPATPEDIYVSWAPYFHIMGLCYTVFWNTYSNRRDIVIKTENFLENPLRWMQTIEKYQGTMTMAPNSAYLTCVRTARERKIDLSSLHYVGNGSEPVLENEYQDIVSFLKDAGVKESALYHNYGLSESTGIISEYPGNKTVIVLDNEALKKNRIQLVDQCNPTKTSKKIITAGKVLGDLKAVILNPNDQSVCKPDEVGELYLQGDNIACGYWKNEESSKEIFRNMISGYDGSFLQTGDLGFFHNGLLYILGRRKEMIVINGQNIYPRDVTFLIKSHVKMLESCNVCAFSIDTLQGEKLIIAAEYESNYKDLCNQIKQLFIQYLGFEPYDIILVPRGEIPHTDNGKLSVKHASVFYQLGKMKIEYSMKYEESNEEIRNYSEAGQKIKDIFELILGVKCTSMNDNFFNLGGNSLNTLSLLKEIKSEFGVYITADEILESATIESIEKYIKNRQEKEQIICNR